MGKPKIDSFPSKVETTSKSERTALVMKATRKVHKGNKIPITMRQEDLLTCRVNVLEDINELARKYRGRLNLSLKFTKATGSQQAINPELNKKLVRWESELNAICILDPVIAVENFVDNEGPPADFNYVRENITNEVADKLLDPSFLVGCECFPRCSHNKCTCPKDSGGHFGYDRSKRILLAPGSPIYECNSHCKCSIDCPNRVIQKGTTARVRVIKFYL